MFNSESYDCSDGLWFLLLQMLVSQRSQSVDMVMRKSEIEVIFICVLIWAYVFMKEHCRKGGLRACTEKPLYPLCVCVCARTHTGACFHIWLCTCLFCFSVSFLSSEETPMFSTYCRASIYLHSPDSHPAVCQMSRTHVSYVKLCISY